MHTEISVVIPTHNPDPGRLARTLQALCSQSFPADKTELLIIANACASFPDTAFFQARAPQSFRIVQEPLLGLTAARKRGFASASSPLLVLVDDDNVLAPDYLEKAADYFSAHAAVGAAGGKSLPEFEAEPPAWAIEFLPLLALRDLGEQELCARGLTHPDSTRREYPAFAPIGAGMVLRREAVSTWLQRPSPLTDRQGAELTSSGDNDIVFAILEAGWHVAYLPQLVLRHLIPASRLQPAYLARLNRGIQKSWTQVLLAHHACPWPTVPAWTVALRKLKAWFSYKGWRRPAGHIRWQGACGHFEGRSR